MRKLIREAMNRAQAHVPMVSKYALENMNVVGYVRLAIVLV
jgi:hypothetical protein